MNFDNQYETVKEHYLDPVELGITSTFYLRREPKSRMMSTLLIFTPENIVITGDLRPGQQGVISCIGYGIGWFGARLSSDYLAEKFLDKCYESDRAREDAEYCLNELIKEGWECRDKDTLDTAKKLRDLMKEERDWMFDEPSALRESLQDAGLYYLCDFGVPFGWGYPTADYCWLAAIQKRFSEVYQEWIKTEEGLRFINAGKETGEIA